MTEESLKKIFEEKDIPIEVWGPFNKINFIQLKNGFFVVPNDEHYRFLITKKYDILLKCSESSLYGTSILGLSSISSNGKSITVQENQFKKDFRKPKQGDILVVWKNKDILYEGYILNTVNSFNGFLIELNHSINLKPNCHIGFYDPKKMKERNYQNLNFKFLNFIEPTGGKNSNYGKYTLKIKKSEIEIIRGNYDS